MTKTRSAALGLALVLAASAASADDIEGQFRLVRREFASGQTIVPPAIVGSWTTIAGERQLNVAWVDAQGRPGAIGLASHYRLGRDTYAETLHSLVVVDGGQLVVHDVTRETKTSPVERQGGRVSYLLPFEAPINVTFDDDRMTSTNPGVFVDYWVRVK